MVMHKPDIETVTLLLYWP